MARAINSITRKPGWRQRVTTLILIPPACFAAYYLGGLVAGPKSFPTRLPIVGGLHIDAKYLDLGVVWETPDHVVVIPVRNVGSTPVTVAEFATSCDCLGVEPKSLTLRPGERADVTLKIDLTHRQQYQLGLARRDVSVWINPVFAGDFAPTPGWELKGVVLSRVSLEATSLAFADQCVRGGPLVARKVRMIAHTPLDRLEASVTPELAVVQVKPDGASNRYTLVVIPKPTLPVGPFDFHVQITAVTPDGVRHRCGAVQASGEMQPPIQVLPRVVLLGEYPVPNRREADVTIRLPGYGWVIDRVETSDPDTTVFRSGTNRIVWCGIGLSSTSAS